FNPLSIVLNTIVVPYFSLLVIPLMFVLTLIASLPILPTALDTFFSHIHALFMTVVKQVDHLFYRSEEHTSELQSRFDIVCRLLRSTFSSLLPYTTLFRSHLTLYRLCSIPSLYRTFLYSSFH